MRTIVCNMNKTLIISILGSHINFECSNIIETKYSSCVWYEGVFNIHYVTTLLTNSRPIPTFFFLVFSVREQNVFALKKKTPPDHAHCRTKKLRSFGKKMLAKMFLPLWTEEGWLMDHRSRNQSKTFQH